MPKNLRHIFRSELIKQRKTGLKTTRQQIKKAHNGKIEVRPKSETLLGLYYV